MNQTAKACRDLWCAVPVIIKLITSKRSLMSSYCIPNPSCGSPEGLHMCSTIACARIACPHPAFPAHLCCAIRMAQVRARHCASRSPQACHRPRSPQACHQPRTPNANGQETCFSRFYFRKTQKPIRPTNTKTNPPHSNVYIRTFPRSKIVWKCMPLHGRSPG